MRSMLKREVDLNEDELTVERISELRRKHNLPELCPIPRTRDDENAQYLQSRLSGSRS